MLSFAKPLSSLTHPPAAPQPTSADRWHAAAEADYRLARLFADRFDARLNRPEYGGRVGWERDGRSVYGLLLPDPLPSAPPADDDWYIYYVWGETMFRRTRRERERLRMLVLPDSVEDWAQMLRLALRENVFDVRWGVTPHYVNALGEVEHAPSGYEFTLSACAPPPAVTCVFQVSAQADTPQEAAREACRRWLRTVGTDGTA